MKFKQIAFYPLKELIDKTGLSYRELSKKTGYHYTYLYKLANEKITCSEKKALDIIKKILLKL